ncbi:eukaryotic translation elongation factor 1 [Echinococcus multilocularis]|uniref:Eukaryotic translation elongation factor 1 n=1 Tax=Echinococcus multilocularis TaxID=6211 RepID=A0A087VYS3_ECHMU|nr:eukaryotic translation elongation factor 1 [Echinococcus multilocularis]
MSISGKLYTPPDYHKALRAQLAAAYSGVPLELVEYCPGISSLPDEAKSCPAEAAPVFHARDGVTLFDANAIAYFLGNKQLRGGEHEYYVTQWANFTDHILMPSIAAWLYPTIGATNYNMNQVKKGQENIKKALTFLNDFLASKTYFVDEHITQADLTVFSALRLLFEKLLDEAGREPYPHLVRWYTTIANQPEVMVVVGEMKLCDKPVVFDPKNVSKHEKQKNVKNQEKQQEKKQQPKEEAPKVSRSDLEEEEEKPASESRSNPLVQLPAGTFNYSDFKKVFSNEDCMTATIPFFWKTFDPTTDSIWYCEYNYPEELKLTFMSANLLRGMFQRLEKMQKFSFAIMHVYGENNNSTIGGIWVWRGTGLIFDLSPDLQTDYESYTWTKLDPDCPDTKAKIADFFALGDVCDGKAVAETCVFK